MQYRYDTRLVDTGQPVQFFHDGYALRFIVGAFYQIRNPVYHHQMDTAILIMVFVQALDNGKQAFFPAHSRKTIRLEPFRHRLTSASPQQVADILIQLYFALFRVIEQYRLVPAVFVERNAQRIHIRSGVTDSTGNQCRHIVAFSRAFSAGDTKQVALSSERHVIYRYDHLCNGRRVVEIHLAGFQCRHGFAV